jgi:hypothetical protein
MFTIHRYFRSGKRKYNNYFWAFTVVAQLPQISYYDPFNHCAGPVWVQIQNPWSKWGPWWRSEIPKAELLLLKLIHLFAREVILVKKLEIEETKTT